MGRRALACASWQQCCYASSGTCRRRSDGCPVVADRKSRPSLLLVVPSERVFADGCLTPPRSL
jgi:hypothetical protein